jgi:hypothetical protein
VVEKDLCKVREEGGWDEVGLWLWGLNGIEALRQGGRKQEGKRFKYDFRLYNRLPYHTPAAENSSNYYRSQGAEKKAAALHGWC